MFSTAMGMLNFSQTFLGKKGSVAGVALGYTSTYTNYQVDFNTGIGFDSQIVGASLTGFYTKPVTVNDRLSVSPMLAVSAPFFQHDVWNDVTTFTKDLLFIIGSNFSYSLTQRFGINVGVNVIEATIPEFPTLKSFTIGGRLSF